MKKMLMILLIALEIFAQQSTLIRRKELSDSVANIRSEYQDSLLLYSARWQNLNLYNIKDYAGGNDPANYTASQNAALFDDVAAADNYRAKIIYIPSGKYDIASVTLPDSMVLFMQPGAVLNISSGSLFEIEGVLEAPHMQIFAGGSVKLGMVNMLLPQWFGAAGDGITNSTEALQKAVDAAQTGQTVYLPGGSYGIDSTIDINKSINLVGAPGAELRELEVFGSFEPDIHVSSDDVVISDIAIIGKDDTSNYTISNNRAALYIAGCSNVSVRRFSATGTVKCIRLENVHNSEFRDIYHRGITWPLNYDEESSWYYGGGSKRLDLIQSFRFMNSSGNIIDGFHASYSGNGIVTDDYSQKNTITNCRITQMMDNGVYFSTNTTGNTITASHIYDCDGMGIKLRGSNNAAVGNTIRNAFIGMSITGGYTSEWDLDGRDWSGTIVQGNVFDSTEVCAIVIGHSTHHIEGVVIEGNQFKNSTYGEAFRENYGAIRFEWRGETENTIISGNIFLSTYGKKVINIIGTDTAKHKNIIIADNIFDNQNDDGIPTDGGTGIRANDARNLKITGNIFRNFSGYPCYFDSVWNSEFDYNTAVDSVESAIIWCGSDSYNNRISFNRSVINLRDFVDAEQNILYMNEPYIIDLNGLDAKSSFCFYDSNTVFVKHNDLLDPDSTNFTYEILFTASEDDPGYLFSKHQDTSNFFTLWTNSLNRVIFTAETNDNEVIRIESASGIFEAGKPCHLFVSVDRDDFNNSFIFYNGDTVRLYGTGGRNVSSVNIDNSGGFTIGGLSPTSHRFTGTISLLRYYTEAISVDKMKEIYNKGRPHLYNNIASDELTAWWRFNENAGYQIRDYKNEMNGEVRGLLWSGVNSDSAYWITPPLNSPVQVSAGYAFSHYEIDTTYTGTYLMTLPPYSVLKGFTAVIDSGFASGNTDDTLYIGTPMNYKSIYSYVLPGSAGSNEFVNLPGAGAVNFSSDNLEIRVTLSSQDSDITAGRIRLFFIYEHYRELNF